MAKHIHIQGIVQGVGFRPFVYRCALKAGVFGTVCNAVDGVHIHAEASDEALASFIELLRVKTPAASRIENISVEEEANKGCSDFRIIESDSENAEVTLVSPDIATCKECVEELFDPGNRRYMYPFINCTNCGPRFTIIDCLPYDRPKTSMASFLMCEDCAKEYANPLDRRFHAQPDACFECGPSLTLIENAEHTTAHDATQTNKLISRCVELLKDGKILAIKGLGGYHLCCDANNEVAVATLRERKHRLAKPLAVMAPTIECARRYCNISEKEEELLSSSVAPILLLRRKADAAELKGLADNLQELGVMLPYTPVQHLLLREFGDILVMTSGNISEEPIIGDNKEAVTRLGNIADAFLTNDRDILSRYDDSIIRVVDGDVTVVRRARGLAPTPLLLPEDLRCAVDEHPLFAGGPEQKSTFALCNGKHVFVSQHLGDLENASTMRAWQNTRELYEHLFRIEPKQFVCDMHPEYLSSKELRANAAKDMLFEVQHHHAHIASVLGENDYRSAVVGIALDGTGYGTDGTIWGGEIMIATRADFKRVAHIEPFALPGGAAAVRKPARIAYAYLAEHSLLEHPGAQDLIAALDETERATIPLMVERGLNSPLASSAGRLFDMAAALSGVAFESRYEGEASILFEAAMDEGTTLEQHASCSKQSTNSIDPLPAVIALLDAKAAGASAHELSAQFHAWFCSQVVLCASAIAHENGIDAVALSGGCFANRTLYTNIKHALTNHGLTVLTPKELPCNDGCISYGQTIIAAAKYCQLSRMLGV